MFQKQDRKGIRTLFRWKRYGITSPQEFKTVCDLDDIGHLPSRRPIIPCSTFLTDGVSIKILLLCFDKHDTITKLDESGYSGISMDHVDLSNVKTGLYFLNSCTFFGEFKETRFTGIDPGVQKPVAWTSITEPDMSDDRQNLVNEILHNTRYVSEFQKIVIWRSQDQQRIKLERIKGGN